MTEEKVKKGVELLERLKGLNEEKKLWEKGVGIHNIILSNKYEYISKDDVYNVRGSLIDFDKLKSDTLANIDKMIKDAQKELDKL